MLSPNTVLMNAPKSSDASKKPETPPWVELVCESVASVSFGMVQIVVHNSKVVQIEKTEKLRLDPHD